MVTMWHRHCLFTSGNRKVDTKWYLLSVRSNHFHPRFITIALWESSPLKMHFSVSQIYHQRILGVKSSQDAFFHIEKFIIRKLWDSSPLEFYSPVLTQLGDIQLTGWWKDSVHSFIIQTTWSNWSQPSIKLAKDLIKSESVQRQTCKGPDQNRVISASNFQTTWSNQSQFSVKLPNDLIKSESVQHQMTWSSQSQSSRLPALCRYHDWEASELKWNVEFLLQFLGLSACWCTYHRIAFCCYTA